MKKVSIASLLVASAVAFNPGIISNVAWGQLGTGASGQVQLDPAEFADYDNAVNKQTTPQTQIPALEAFLAKYPKSAVKTDVQTRLMIDYSGINDAAKAIDAADKVLQLTPNNLQAYIIEVAYRGQMAAASTDPGTRQTGLDASADFAKRGLGVTTKLTGMSDSDFAAQKAYATPVFNGAIATDALAKKDYPSAIAAYKAELASMKSEDTTKPSALQDTYYLGQAYYQSTPPDYVNCTFYTTRAAALAPDQFKPQLQPLATYCYKKYHGGTDGYDAVTAAATANVNPPAGFSIVPAPTNEDIVKKTIADTPDLATLALSDKEFILQYGKMDDADKVFATIKGKTTEIPDATIIDGSTVDKLLVAVSDDAVQSKTADFTYNMKTPLKTLPAAGTKITLTGTYTSYTQKPLMIIMDGGEEVKKAAAPVKKAPVRRR